MSCSNSASTISVRRGSPNRSLISSSSPRKDLQQPLAGLARIFSNSSISASAAQLVADLVALQPGQALQAQLQDGPRLGLGQAVGAVLGDHAVPGSSIRAISGPTSPAGQARAISWLARRLRIGRGADQGDHLVDIGHRDGEAEQHVGPVPRLAELEDGAPGDDLLAEGDEGGG